jgi:hypothetical protein
MTQKAILFLLPDCPGYFTQLFYEMGAELKKAGYAAVFASTTPFYEKFKNVDLSEVGRVYYLNEFLEATPENANVEQVPIDHWSYYASFARQSYYFGKPLNSMEVLKRTKLFFLKIAEENNIVLFYSETVSNSFLYLAHDVASSRNIPFFGLMGARIPHHYNVHIDVAGNEVLVNEDAPEEYVPTNAALDYMNNSQFAGLFDKQYSLLSLSFFKEIFHYIRLKSYWSLETGHTKYFLIKVYKIALKRMLADFYFSKIANIFMHDIEFRNDKIFVVYPLHVYPEASTSVFAKFYDGNEYNLIKNIAFSLPTNVVLVVKEHKANVGTNTKAFYKKLKLLPNVILLDPYFNLRDNVHKFDAVITLSSTVGFEALTQGVPVLVLGETAYQKYPGCKKINSYSELEECLGKLGKKKQLPGANQTFNLYSKMSFPGSFNYMDRNCLNKKNIELLLKPVLLFCATNKLSTHRNN